jgi:hypothetical protein
MKWWSTRVNGLEIPPALLAAMQAGGWSAPSDTARLQEILPLQRVEDPYFCTLPKFWP